MLVNDSAVLTNFLYEANSGYLNLPADTYNVEIALAGGGPTVLTTPLTLVDGQIVSVFAIGGANEQPASVLPVIYRQGATPTIIYLPILTKN